MNAAVELARMAGADETNVDDTVTWEQRMRITRHTLLMVVIPYLKKETMFVVRVPGLPFIKRRVTWGWLERPINMLFARAIKDMTPVEVSTDAP